MPVPLLERAGKIFNPTSWQYRQITTAVANRYLNIKEPGCPGSTEHISTIFKIYKLSNYFPKIKMFLPCPAVTLRISQSLFFVQCTVIIPVQTINQ